VQAPAARLADCCEWLVCNDVRWRVTAQWHARNVAIVDIEARTGMHIARGVSWRRLRAIEWYSHRNTRPDFFLCDIPSGGPRSEIVEDRIACGQDNGSEITRKVGCKIAQASNRPELTEGGYNGGARGMKLHSVFRVTQGCLPALGVEWRSSGRIGRTAGTEADQARPGQVEPARRRNGRRPGEGGGSERLYTPFFVQHTQHGPKLSQDVVQS
jgi:hypothetical protein